FVVRPMFFKDFLFENCHFSWSHSIESPADERFVPCRLCVFGIISECICLLYMCVNYVSMSVLTQVREGECLRAGMCVCVCLFVYAGMCLCVCMCVEGVSEANSLDR